MRDDDDIFSRSESNNNKDPLDIEPDSSAQEREPAARREPVFSGFDDDDDYEEPERDTDYASTYVDDSLELEDDDFVYSDPPYDVPFRQYSRHGFEWSEQVRLAHWLARHKGPVVLSNQATERILALYESLGFRLVLLDAPRRISRTGDRTPAREVLATRGFD